MTIRHPARWLVWGLAGMGGGLLAATLALMLLVMLVVTALSGGSSSSGVAATTTAENPAAQSALGMTHVWTGARNQAVVTQAVRIAAALYNGPPNNYTTWYHAEQIPDAVAYWQRTCTGGCAENWAQGNLQCTMLVTASYGLAGQDLPFAGDAATFVSWHPYQNRPGWAEIPPDEQPLPGDIVVWDSGTAFGGAGHVAIVVDVKVPTPQEQGYVQFVQANGGSALAQSPLLITTNGQLHMRAWPGYTVLGYIRHTTFVA